LLAAIVLLMSAHAAFAGTVTLSWDPNIESDLAGYLLSYGTAPGTYTGTIDVGNVTSYQFSEPDPRVRYYLAVRAYNTAGMTSGYSNETVTTPALTVTGITSSQSSPQQVGATITFTATAIGGTPPHQFKWWIDDGTRTTLAQDWSTGNTVTWGSLGQEWTSSSTFTWTPTSANQIYTIRVWGRNAGDPDDEPDNPGATLDTTFTITSPNVLPPPSNGGAQQASPAAPLPGRP
jgi:hypothetical protein